MKNIKINIKMFNEQKKLVLALGVEVLISKSILKSCLVGIQVTVSNA